jgi:indole-3-glycerol phosphate synthase
VEHIPSEVVAVAESGIGGDADVRLLADLGYQAVLVGESLIRASDRRGAVRALTGHRVGGRAGASRAAATER